MFPDRYSEIFGLGERLGYILNLGILLTLSKRIFEFASMSITLAPKLFFEGSKQHLIRRKICTRPSINMI